MCSTPTTQIILPDRDGCPLCTVVSDGRKVVASNGVAVVFEDGFPVSDIAHWLVVTRTHVGNMFSLPDEDLTEYFRLVQSAGRQMLATFPAASGINIGANVGLSAGMTVPHVHTHLIARRTGDTADPRGGVRWVVPEKADYWTPGN